MASSSVCLVSSFKSTTWAAFIAMNTGEVFHVKVLLQVFHRYTVKVMCQGFFFGGQEKRNGKNRFVDLTSKTWGEEVACASC